MNGACLVLSPGLPRFICASFSYLYLLDLQVDPSRSVFVIFVTFFLLLTAGTSPDPTMSRPHQIQLWATFLGVSSGILAAVQYAPQLQRTYNLKLVGALSMPMMIIQCPGGVIMAASVAMKPGTNWTSTY